MKFTPSSGTRRNIRRHSRGSSGSPQMPSPVTRMAPKPRRWTGNSPPSLNSPAGETLRSFIAHSSSFRWAVVQDRQPSAPSVAPSGCLVQLLLLQRALHALVREHPLLQLLPIVKPGQVHVNEAGPEQGHEEIGVRDGT